MLARAAWYRDDVHEAARWLGDISLLGTPLFPHALVRLILGARVASAAGDAGLRARVLQATEVLERERPAVPLLAAVAGYARGILERDAQALMAAADALRSSSRPLLYASAAEDAGGELSRAQRNAEALDQLNAAFDTYIACEATADARRVGRALRRLGVERRIVTHPRAKTGSIRQRTQAPTATFLRPLSGLPGVIPPIGILMGAEASVRWRPWSRDRWPGIGVAREAAEGQESAW